MKHWTTYPLLSHPPNPELIDGAGLARFAQAAEEAGFDGIAFTDHPAPSQRWLDAGGHDALDPFAALSFAAAVTKRLQLIPNVVVLPYRNPLAVAKSAATIDALSGGRFVLSVATGYLRSEYRAMGVDFARRNELFDESLKVLRGVWTTDDFSYEGSGFTAIGVTANPKPKRIPIWLDDLATMVDDLRHDIGRAGRDPATVDIAFTTGEPGPADVGYNAQAHLDALARMKGMGVTWNSLAVPGDSLDRAIEALQRYGEEVISQQ
jgi:hypothetical protein